MQLRKISAGSMAAIIGLAGFAQPAFAYLDPSTGSMILSAILGILATVGLALKTYWYKFKSWFRGKPSPPPAEVPYDESAADSGSNPGRRRSVRIPPRMGQCGSARRGMRGNSKIK